MYVDRDISHEIRIFQNVLDKESLVSHNIILNHVTEFSSKRVISCITSKFVRDVIFPNFTQYEYLKTVREDFIREFFVKK